MRNSYINIKYKKFKQLTSLLLKWIKIQESYSKNYNNDSLYWYNERATLSTLAGAVWKCGEFSLEEYRVTKKYRKEAWTGRADLWFTWKNTEYQVETKQIWVSLSNKAYNSPRYIKKALDEAIKDAVSSNERRQGHTLGIVFVIPYIASSEKEHLNKALKMFIKEIEQVDYDIMAYTFPPYCRSLHSDKYYYPGVVLVGRVPKRK